MNKKAFTLIELLVVVLIIGILAGVTMSFINIQGTKDKTKDGVRASNIQKLAEGIETFKTLEKHYPAQGTGNNPFTGADAETLSNYVSQWPQDTTDSYLYYQFGTAFVVGVKNSDGNYFKYYSGWGKVQECSSLQADDMCIIN